MELVKIYNSLKSVYLKLLLVNKETNIYECITIPEDENPPSNDITDYFNWFINGNYIHPDDRNVFEEFTKKLCVNADVIYRRKTGSGFKSVYMELRHCDEKHYIICVRDIDTTFKREALKVSEDAKRYDSVTGLLNHKAFNDDIKKELKGNVGIAFLDINGLKYTNDNIGHSEGDKLILRVAKYLKEYFPAYSIYRTGGDEFVVTGFNIKTRTFLHTVTAFHKRFWNDHDTYTMVKDKSFPMLSVGYSADVCEDIQEIIEDAEAQMYEDKAVFYNKFPELKR